MAQLQIRECHCSGFDCRVEGGRIVAVRAGTNCRFDLKTDLENCPIAIVGGGITDELGVRTIPQKVAGQVKQ
jgi:hypothetical protein